MVEVNGVPCRGALLRDVSAYLVTCSVVLAMFSSGRIALNPDVAALLSMYFAFIFSVPAASLNTATTCICSSPDTSRASPSASPVLRRPSGAPGRRRRRDERGERPQQGLPHARGS